jgi:hypothetical protein
LVANSGKEKCFDVLGSKLRFGGKGKWENDALEFNLTKIHDTFTSLNLETKDIKKICELVRDNMAFSMAKTGIDEGGIMFRKNETGDYIGKISKITAPEKVTMKSVTKAMNSLMVSSL